MEDYLRDYTATLLASQQDTARNTVNALAGTWITGTIAAINTGLPATVDLYLNGDASQVIPAVPMIDSFNPVVGAKVNCAVVDGRPFVVCHLSENANTGWQTLSLGSGFSHDGNSQGNVQYRRILDNGSWKMQWQGGLGITGSPTNVENTPLSSIYRPAKKRSIPLARDVFNGSTMVSQIDFQTDGTLDLITINQVGQANAGNDTTGASPNTNSVDPIDSTTTDSGHSHGVTGSHSHTVDNHWHNIQTHTHGVLYPTWITLHGVEYFL
ncbi:hypothetical protein [Streptomyces sp. NPDC055085]